MDADYEPPFVHNETGERGATVIQVDTGKHANLIANCAIVCGACVALAVVCAGICWWAITENRVTIANYTRINEQNKALEVRIAKLETSHE